MRILCINYGGGGFADFTEVAEGTTVAFGLRRTLCRARAPHSVSRRSRMQILRQFAPAFLHLQQ